MKCVSGIERLTFVRLGLIHDSMVSCVFRFKAVSEPTIIWSFTPSKFKALVCALVAETTNSKNTLNKEDKNNFRVEKAMILVVSNDANPNICLGHIGKDSKILTWISTLKKSDRMLEILHRTGIMGNCQPVNEIQN